MNSFLRDGLEITPYPEPPKMPVKKVRNNPARGYVPFVCSTVKPGLFNANKAEREPVPLVSKFNPDAWRVM